MECWFYRWLRCVRIRSGRINKDIDAPGSPKKDEEMLEHSEMWQDKIGLKHMEITTSWHSCTRSMPEKILMTGTAKKYFDLWRQTGSIQTRRGRTGTKSS